MQKNVVDIFYHVSNMIEDINNMMFARWQQTLRRWSCLVHLGPHLGGRESYR